MTDANLSAPWPPWWERAGGRWALSWQEFAVSLPLAALSIFAANADQIHSVADFGRWSLVVVFAVACALLWAGVVVLIRHRWPQAMPATPLVVVGGALAIGALFGASSSLAIALLGLPSDRSALMRTVVSAVFIGWWAIAMSLVLDGRARLREQREALLADAIALESARAREDAVVAEMRAQIAATVGTTLDESRAALDRALAASESPMPTQWPQLALALRQTAHASVRPLGHDLWDAANAQYARPRPWSAFGYLVDNQPFRPLAVSALYAVSSGAALVNDVGARAGVPVVAGTVVFICALMLAANALMRRLPEHHRAIYLAGIVVVQSGAVFVNPVREALGLAPKSLPELAIDIVAGVVIIVMTSAFGAFRRMHADQLAAIQADVDAQRVDQIARSRQLGEVLREAGAIVHGAVQSRLLSAAIAIDQAAAHGDATRIGAAIEQARSALSARIFAEESTPLTLAEHVARKQALWAGLCAIDIDVDLRAGSLVGRPAVDAGRVVEEAIANAIRHGRADRVRISIGPADDGLLIEVADDGSDWSPASAPGVGTALLDATTAGAWTRHRQPTGGTVLTATVPLDGPAS